MNTKKVFILSILISLIPTCSSFPAIINPNNPQEGWKNSHAYRPYPILFLHGFAKGSPQTWTEARADESLNKYYFKYYYGYSPDPTILLSTRYPYLEIIDFGSDIIDRNSSIDTYKLGDRYVLTGKRKSGDPGWSDKLNAVIETLRQSYRNIDGSRQKIILVSHSMGGLAARKYLKSYIYTEEKADKIILIGTPNLGSMLAATVTLPYERNRRLGWYLFPQVWVSSTLISITDMFLESSNFIDMYGDAVWDMDPISTGSGFISELNTNYSEKIKHFAIAGKHWLGFNLGDTIVSLDSQLGAGILSLEGKSIINATHRSEPALSIQGDNPLLKFLDSTTPELEITSPEPNTAIEIGENFIRIQDKVYKEYLPADSKLIVNITKQEGNSVLRPQTSLLKASDLWIPNNPDSPVAEIDEKIYFPGPGTYSVSCKVENPAGTYSNEVNIQIKVSNAGPIIAEMHPTGIIYNTNPVIYARILSPAGLAIDLNSIKILLDDTVVAHNVNPKENNLETEVSYIPSEGLKRTFHTVSISAADISGKTNNRTWSFEIAAIPESIGDYVWGDVNDGEIVSHIRKENSERTQFNLANFREDLLKTRERTISNLKTNIGSGDAIFLIFSWLGYNCRIRSYGAINFRMPEIANPDAIPVYVVIHIDVSRGAFISNFIKSMTLEINNESFELSEGYQRLISGQGLNFILPYTDNVTISASFDPYIYNLDDYMSENGEFLDVVNMSIFTIKVDGIGWWWWPRKN